MESTLRAPSINPGAYLSADTLRKELDKIWPAAWHLVALTRDLPDDKDYLRKRIANTDLVLHRLGERIIAYANVCPHRFSALVAQPSGNAPLQCPYHLWSFDAEGYPSAIPHRQGIPLAEFTRGARLSTWHVALVGEFIFVSKQPTQSCEEYLGTLHEDLARMSRALGNEFPPVTLNVAANWKIIAQNTVELQHAYSVHPGTFAALSSKPMQIDSDPPLANSISYVMRLKTERYEGRLNTKLRALLNRVDQPFPDGYRHHLIFPATTLGHVDNRTLTLIDYQPLAADECCMSVRMFEFVVPCTTPLEASILASIYPLDHQFALQVFEEDGSICEAVQRGLGSRPADMPGVLMPVEHMVARFQDMYQLWMSQN